jgi:glycosyltransferase involved in cell wall biosynthesis
MKILYVYDNMPGIYQKYLLNILKIITSSLNVKTLTYSKFDKANFVVKSYSLNDNFQRLLYRLKLSKYKTTDLKIFNQFDLIHIQHSFLFNKIIPLLGFRKRPKIVFTLRGGDTYIKPWIDKRWEQFYKSFGNKIDAFVTVSQNQKEYLQRWGINEEKIHVIPVSFGIKSDAKPKYPNTEKLKLVSAFRMTWEKNIEGSIQLAKKLKALNIPFEYDIFGSGNDLGQLYYLIDKYNLKENVKINGKIDNNILKEKYSNYDFFVQLSVSEALSASVIEAQSEGLPCIVSNSGGLTEAVLKNQTAIVYDYNEYQKIIDECLELWQNKEKYFQFSKNAIAFVNDNFTLQHEEKKLNQLYHSLI